MLGGVVVWTCPIRTPKQERHSARWERERDEERPRVPCQFRFYLSSIAGPYLSVLLIFVGLHLCLAL